MTDMNIPLFLKFLEYKNGNLYWKIAKSNKVKVGDLAGNKQPSGHMRIVFDGKKYLVHRIIFFMHYGYLPRIIDHIDCDPTNNHIENLRAANYSQNLSNSKLQKRNTTGVKNVTKVGNKYRVQIRANKKYINIGNFETLELARLAAIEARKNYHKEFANHGEAEKT